METCQGKQARSASEQGMVRYAKQTYFLLRLERRANSGRRERRLGSVYRRCVACPHILNIVRFTLVVSGSQRPIIP